MACSGVSKHGFCADAGLDLKRTECPIILEYGWILRNDALVEEFSKYVRVRVPRSAGPVLDCIGGIVTM